MYNVVFFKKILIKLFNHQSFNHFRLIIQNKKKYLISKSFTMLCYEKQQKCSFLRKTSQIYIYSTSDKKTLNLII